jgi:membrane fusion protein, multidrug efflux system
MTLKFPFAWTARNIAIAAAVVVAGIAAALLWGANSGKSRVRPPAVVIARASVADVTVVEHVMATVVANTTVQVGAQVTGQLQRAVFAEGQIVKKGDLLFVIDPRPFEAAVQEAEAQRDRDRAQLVNALATKRRYDALFAQDAISRSQKDTADATAQSAAATVAADSAQLATARINLGYTQIRSPVDGKTGPILIQPGNLVTANASNLVVITQIEPVKLSFSLSQSNLPAIQARERSGTLFALIAGGRAPVRAPVEFVGNQVSSTSGTIELRAIVDNRDHRLVPGEIVNVDVTLNTLPKAVVVPREAVNDGPAGRYVFVVGAGEIAEMRPVTVLYDDGTRMAVRGVRPRERVIIDGQLRVLPGGKVQVAKPRKPAGAP